MSKFELNLPTISGFVVLSIILFMLLSVIIQQFIPTFKGLEMKVGSMFIVMIMSAMVVIMILKREFSFAKEDILPLIITVGIIIAIIFFVPKLLQGTIFEQSAIQLSTFGR